MKLPDCHEVCKDCESGHHVFHVLNELGEIYAFRKDIETNGKKYQDICIGGWAEDEFWLENLLECVGGAMEKTECQHCHNRSFNPKTNYCYNCSRTKY